MGMNSKVKLLLSATIILGLFMAGIITWRIINPYNPPLPEVPPLTAFQESTPVLEHIATYEMHKFTHRPEILLSSTENPYLLVVEHQESEEGQIRHMGYQIEDFENLEALQETGFPVTYETDEYGSGADHRAVIFKIDGEEQIGVFYQTLIMSDDAPAIIEGPSEPYTESQSLMFARFSMDGEELFRTEVARTTDRDEDNFPDMCALWNPVTEVFVVSTGGKQAKIREIDINGEILSAYEYSSDEIAGSIGNSIILEEDGSYLVFSSKNNPQGEDYITITELSSTFEVESQYKTFEVTGAEETFPTGVIYQNGYYFVGHISGEFKNIQEEEEKKYGTKIKIFNKELELIDDIEVSSEYVSGHGHPTLIIKDSILYYAWSKSVDGAPQVMIDVFELSFEDL